MTLRAKPMLVCWIASGLALLSLEVVVWAWSHSFQLWLGELQKTYGVPEPVPWALQTDTHAHMLVSFTVVLWFAFGCRLLAPRAIPWLPLAGAVVVALCDEIMQLGSAARTFDFGDMAADVTGMVAAVPFALLLRRLPIAAAEPSQRG